MAANSSGVCSRPVSRIDCSSSFVFTRPTGAARFCAWSAATTSFAATPAAAIACGWSSTVSSRFWPPTSRTSATPGTARSSRETTSSASRVSAGTSIVSEVRVSETIGSSAGSNRVMIGSSISSGRSARFSLIASRMSCVASCRSFSKSKNTMNCASPSVAEAVVCLPSIPLMEKIASSIGSMISRSTVSGEAPG